MNKGVLIDYGRIEIINASGLMKANPLQEIVIKLQEEAKLEFRIFLRSLFTLKQTFAYILGFHPSPP